MGTRHFPVFAGALRLFLGALSLCLFPAADGLAQVRPRQQSGTERGEFADGFSRVAWIRELTDGRVIIADQLEQRLLIADFRTGRLEDIARKGPGPGEFEYIDALIALGADSTLVEDRRSRRWLIFHATKAVATLSIPPSARAPNSFLRGAGPRGRLLDLQSTAFRRSPGVPFTRGRQNAESLLVVIRYLNVKPPGGLQTRVDTVTTLRGRARGQTVAMRRAVSGASPIRWWLESPLAAEEQAVLFPDGWIALARAEPYRVDWITPEGRRISGPPIDVPPVAVDDAVKRAFVEWKYPKVTPQFTNSELPPWPRVLPPFLNDAVFAAPDGRLVIRRVTYPIANGTHYDIVNRAGKVTGRMALRADERIVGFGAGSAYIVRRDGDEVEWLSRQRWP